MIVCAVWAPRAGTQHAPVRFVDDHVEAVGSSLGGVGERLPKGVLAIISLRVKSLSLPSFWVLMK